MDDFERFLAQHRHVHQRRSVDWQAVLLVVCVVSLVLMAWLVASRP